MERIDKSKLKANWLERIIDRTVAVFAPGLAQNMVRMREAFKAFAYKGGQRGQRDRTSATIYPNSSPESSVIQLERIQCMWQSRELSDNFGVADYIYSLFCDYCVPDFTKIRWNTGNTEDDKKLRAKFLIWAKGMCDYRGGDTLNQLARLYKRSQLRDGDMAIRFISEDVNLMGMIRKCLRMQMIEADCIGSPFNIFVTPTYIGGCILDPDTKRVLEYDIYDRPPQGSTYIPLAKVPADEIVHFRKLRRGGQYRGIPLLAPALPAYVDLKEILDNERINTKAQSTIWAFIQSPTGDSSDDEMAYPGLGVPANIDPGTGQNRTYKDLVPGTAMYGNPGEQPVFLKNERPSPAFGGLVKVLFMEIFCCSGVDYAFGYDPSDLQGTAMRLTSAKTQRTFQQDWNFNEEYLFDPIINRWLEHERENGYLDDLSEETLKSRAYENYSLTQPAHPSADVGRESAANLAELAAKVKSRHTIAVEQGLDWEVERQQIEKEDAGLSGGQVAIAESLAKSLGDQGLRALQTLSQSYGTGEISHEGAIGFATVILGLDAASAEKLFPKSVERPPAPPKGGTGNSAQSEDGEKGFSRRFDKDSGRWVTTEEGHKVHIDGDGKADKGNPEVTKDVNKSDSDSEESHAKLSSDDTEGLAKEWTGKLSADEKDAIFGSNGYVGSSGSYLINSELRKNGGKDIPPDSRVGKAVIALSKSLDRSSFPKNATMYRVVNQGGASDQLWNKMTSGKGTLSDKGFTSMTSSREYIDEFAGQNSGEGKWKPKNILCEIQVPKGAKVGTVGRNEQEHIAQRGSKFKVVSAAEENGIRKVVLRMIK